MNDLRTGCDTALGVENLEGLRTTAEAHSKFRDALYAAQEELASALSRIEALSQQWQGADATEFRAQYGEAAREALVRHAVFADDLRAGADTDLGVQTALHFGIAQVLSDGWDRLETLSTKSLSSGKKISVMTGAGLVLGMVGLAWGGAVIGLVGLMTTTASVAGADVTLDPKIETIPGSAVVRGLIANMVTGIESAAADALTLRTDYKTTLDLRLTNNMNDVADPKTVPGSGYYS